MAMAENPKKAEVIRDEYGNPRITAPTNKALFELYGYTRAVDRLWSGEQGRLSARGRLAEIYGKRLLTADKRRRLLGYTEKEYQAIFESLLPETKEILQAYIDGYNRRVDEVLANPDKLLPFEFKKLGLKPFHLTVTDTLASTSASFRRFGTRGGGELKNLAVLKKLMARYDTATAWAMFNDLYWENDPNAPTYIDEEMPIERIRQSRTLDHPPQYIVSLSDVEEAAREYQEFKQAALKRSAEIGMPMVSESASFAWALSGERTATGYPLMSGNPQMGFAFPGVTEVHLLGGTGFNTSGLTSYTGTILGHNADVAWSMMVGMGDNVDIYVETLNPLNHEQYLYKGKWVNMEKREETFKVRGGESERITIYRTIHGPVMSPFPFDATDPNVSHVYTCKYAHWLIEPKILNAFPILSKARNVYEILDAMKYIYTSMNLIIADRHGNIGHAMGGLVPERPVGSDFRLPLSGTGDMEWTGQYRQTPMSVNPKKGYICGWNNKASPQFNNPDNYMFGKFHRSIWLDRALANRSKVTVDDMKEILEMMGSVGSHGVSPMRVDAVGAFLGELLPYLNKAIRAVEPSDAYYDRLRQVLAILNNFDGLALDDVVTSTDLKIGQSILDSWVVLMLQNTFGDEFKDIVSFERYSTSKFNLLVHTLEGPLSPLPPSRNYFDDITTANVVETVDNIVVKSMKQTIERLTTQFKTSDMSKWKVPRPQTKVVHALLGKLDTFPTQNSGTVSFIAECKPSGVEGMSRWPYGSSGFIGMDEKGKPVFDPHLFDMLPLYVGFKYQPMFVE
jgi:penicillin amidase